MFTQSLHNGTLIYLSKSLDSRAKWLNLINFWVFFIGFVGSMAGLLLTPETVFFIIWAVICAIAAYRFGNSASRSERLLLTKEALHIINKSWFKNNIQVFDIRKISNFRHLQKPALSHHPLAGKTFDYLGFETQEKLINEMHGDKRLAFEYEGKQITFGENVYSWEFDELNVLLYDITGNDLRYKDEFEKSFNAQNN